MGFKNVDYNAHLRFDDDNPFKNAFDEAKAEAKARAEEAYDKKKEDFLDDFFLKIRETMNPPEGVQMIIGEGGNARLNKGFYKIMNLTPEGMISMAKKEARKYGLASSAIKSKDIDNAELKSIKDQAVGRHYMALNQYRIANGQHALNRLLENEGDKFAQFYGMFTDPYTDNKISQGEYSLGGIHKQTGLRKEWHEDATERGWDFNAQGNVTNIPGFWDGQLGLGPMPSSGYQVQYDEKGDPFITAPKTFMHGEHGAFSSSHAKHSLDDRRYRDGEWRAYLPSGTDTRTSQELIQQVKDDEEKRNKSKVFPGLKPV